MSSSRLRSILVLFLAALTLLLLSPAFAQRIALVIGNAAYADRPLRNPVNDAQLMQATLRELGFQVQVATDVDRRGLLAALRDFEARARGAEVALFYFAGHGAQVGGANYLIPVNAPIRSETDVPDEALDAASVLRRLEEGRVRVGLVILDACRDNPFPGSARSSTRGLARMSVPTGTIVAYATAPGSTAEDGTGSNGTYTAALARYLATPGLDIKEVFDRTAQEVERVTNGKQRPREEIGLRGRFVLREGAVGLASTTPSPAEVTGGVSLADLEREVQVQQQWTAWQQRMQADFDRVEGFQGWASLRVEAWQRFLGAWAADNPTSNDDERLRQQAQERLAIAQREVQQQRVAVAMPPAVASTTSGGNAVTAGQTVPSRPTLATTEVTPTVGATQTFNSSPAALDALGTPSDQLAATVRWVQAQPPSGWLVQHGIDSDVGRLLELRRHFARLSESRVLALVRADGRQYFALVSGPFDSADGARNFIKDGTDIPSLPWVRSIASLARELDERRPRVRASVGDARLRDQAQQRLRAAEIESQQQRLVSASSPASSVGAPIGSPGQTFKDCAECPEMMEIPAGRFLMGSPESEPGRSLDEGPQRWVDVQRFAMGKFEVTQGQWQAVMGSNPSYFEDCGLNCPVESVSWNDAQEFVRRLNQSTGQNYRLPSEAEWEYAARAGTTTAYFWGDLFDGNQANNGTRMGQAGTYPSNAFGLHDMHGNVWEWVQDVWHANYSGAPSDGSAWLTGGEPSRRVLRGGSWYFTPQNLRSAYRNRNSPVYRNYYTGFRIARTISAIENDADSRPEQQALHQSVSPNRAQDDFERTAYQGAVNPRPGSDTSSPVERVPAASDSSQPVQRDGSTLSDRAAPPSGVVNASPAVAPLPALRLDELPASVQRSIPAMRINAVVQSPSPANRLLLVNGQVLRESETLVFGLRLERIGPDTAIFTWRGQPFQVPYETPEPPAPSVHEAEIVVENDPVEKRDAQERESRSREQRAARDQAAQKARERVVAAIAAKAAADRADRDRIEREKAEKAAADKAARDKREAERLARERERLDREKKETERHQMERAGRERQAREWLKREKEELERLERQRAELDQPPPPSPPPMFSPPPQPAIGPADQPKVDDAIRLARDRDAVLRVLSGSPARPGTGSRGTSSRGSEAFAASPSDTYAGLLIAAFRPNIVLSERLAGNPVAEVEVTADPDGRVIGRRLSKSSGRREWDEAVLRAVDRTRELPKDIDGRVPHKVVIVFRPND